MKTDARSCGCLPPVEPRGQRSIPRGRGQYILRSLRGLRLVSLILTFLLVGIVSTSAAQVGGDLAAADGVLLLERGWIIETMRLERTDMPGVRHLVAEGIINAPAPAIWTVIKSPSDATTKWPGIKEAVTEYVAAETTIARYRLGIPVFRDRRYRIRAVSDPERMLLRFAMIPGYGNVRAIDGAWEVRPLTNGQSRVIYRLDADPGVSMVPRFIVNWATKRAVPRLFSFLYETSSAMSRSHEAAGLHRDPLTRRL